MLPMKASRWVYIEVEVSRNQNVHSLRKNRLSAFPFSRRVMVLKTWEKGQLKYIVVPKVGFIPPFRAHQEAFSCGFQQTVS